MKKVLLTAMALLTIASASAFGMYGDRDSWIDFLVHGNQFRARMDQLGFVLGNGTIKGTFGFRSQAVTTALGNILTTGATGNVDLTTTISAGIGYTSEPFGIGLGYNYTHVHDRLGVHTPVLMINALNNNLRIAIPLQIATSQNPFNLVDPNGVPYNTEKDYLGISTDVQIRYYTGIDAFNQIRVYFKYGQASYKDEFISGVSSDNMAQSVGFETRFYFLNTPVGNVTINPYLKVAFNTSLKGHAVNNQVRAGGAGDGSIDDYNLNMSYNGVNVKGEWEKSPYDVTVAAVLGITANSDIVSLYVEPSLGYKATYNGKYKMDVNGSTTTIDSGKVLHNLSWGAYTELYIRPTQDLEWYFEMDVNNNSTRQESNIPVYFETTTGITWYLPAFN
ncbi:variable surface family protein [Brachyspira hampsonii]|uniref:variable surface family protein n=1 Tax=Brachyspira hampsonii TaxID=1287055 RepID=UPI000D3D2E13|nr:variable surface family protein [Brachyspira hampsonii]PTY41452.1 cell surface protein [Brachyspira hampsonii bv. II]